MKLGVMPGFLRSPDDSGDSPEPSRLASALNASSGPAPGGEGESESALLPKILGSIDELRARKAKEEKNEPVNGFITAAMRAVATAEKK